MTFSWGGPTTKEKTIGCHLANVSIIPFVWEGWGSAIDHGKGGKVESVRLFNLITDKANARARTNEKDF